MISLEKIIKEDQFNQYTLHDVIIEHMIIFIDGDLPYISGVPYYTYKRLIWDAIQRGEKLKEEELVELFEFNDDESEYYGGDYPEDIRLTQMWDYYPKETQDDLSYFSDDYNPESEE